MARLATKVGVEGQALKFETPLLHLSKANIIRLGLEHGVTTVKRYLATKQMTKDVRVEHVTVVVYASKVLLMQVLKTRHVITFKIDQGYKSIL